MCTTNFHLFTYNCHLFGDPSKVNIGPLYEDGKREGVIRQYLEHIQPYSAGGLIQIAALQEVWWRHYVEGSKSSITEGVDSSHHGSYNCRYYLSVGDCPVYCDWDGTRAFEYLILNPSGLILLADPVCKFHDSGALNYMTNCFDPKGWNSQDQPVAKGFLQTTCDFPCSSNSGKTHSFGFFTTHMPTAYNSYPNVECAFTTLASAISKFRSDNGSFGVFLLGDLNIDADDLNGEYTKAVTNTLLNGTSLHDAAAEAASGPLGDPGPTIVPASNTLWQHFNNVTPLPGSTRIDYFFHADSSDGTMTCSVTAIDVITAGLTIQHHDKTYNCSDHYPLEAMVTVTVPDSVCAKL